MAFHDVSTGRAQRLLMRDFGSAFASASTNPAATIAANSHFVRYVGAYRALLRVGHRLELEESSIPLRVASGGGTKRPVDLRLRDAAGGFAPVNPLQRVLVAQRLSGGVAVGPNAVRIVPLGKDVSGRMSGGDSVFFGGVGEDEDATVTPTVSGADIFAVLRSRLSPERLRYRVDLPRDAVLQEVGGGAAVSLNGRELVQIPSPSAHDAQGQLVPVEMMVSGDELLLTVHHGSGRFAYPLLVDPSLVVPSKFRGWTFHGTGGFQGTEPGAVEAPSGEYKQSVPAGGTWIWTGQRKLVLEVAFFNLHWAAGGETEWGAYLAGGDGEETPVGWFAQTVHGGESGSKPVLEGTFRPEGTTGIEVKLFAQYEANFSECKCMKGGASFSVGAITVVFELPSGKHERQVILDEEEEVEKEKEKKEGREPVSEETYGEENPAAPSLHSQCFSGHPVNCATGNQVETQTDLAIGGRGPGLTVTRTYNSKLAVQQGEVKEHGVFGYGWSGPYGAYITTKKTCEGEICFDVDTVHQFNGSTVSFTDWGGEWVAAPWVEAKFHENGSGESVFTLPNQTKLEFNSKGQLVKEIDRDGNEFTLSRNSEGRIEYGQVSGGRRFKFSYNAEGEIEKVEDPMGHAVKYGYESGNLVSVTEPGESGTRWKFKYNSEHELTSETDGRGKTVTTEYNGSQQVTSQTDAMERKRTWKYAAVEPEETETTITEPNGTTTVDRCNAAGLPTKVTHASGTSLAATTTYEYGGGYELLSVTNPDKQKTTYTYDGIGDRTSEKNADGDETYWKYDSTHDIESVITPDEETTTIKREAHGNPESISRPAPGGKTQTTKYKYDTYGDLESVTNPLEQTWKYEYDSYGDRKAETDPEGNKRTWEYNEDSQETAEVSPRGNAAGAKASEFTTKTERNAKGLPLKITDPLSHTTKYTYDGDGNVETVIDGNSHTTKNTYDADNELTKTEEPNKTVTETGYDSMGKVTSQTDGNKRVTKYVRNALEEVEEAVNPLGKKTLKEYDAAGNLIKLTDPAKRTTTYKYDPANRLEEVSYSSGKPATIKYEYNKDGYRTRMTDGTGTTTYTLDRLDRMTESENGHKEIIKYEYNLGNQQTKITYPNTKAVERAYDKDGRLEKVTDWSSNVTKFTYNPDSELEKTIFPTASKDEDTYAYNDADQTTEVKMAKSTETLASLVYTRDDDGQVKKTTSKGLPGTEVTENTYDENNRLTKYGSTEYKYDSANNPTREGSSTNTFNEGDELEKGTGTTYAYDEFGERTKTTPEKGGATTYGYDQTGNLISVERPEKESVPKIADTYAYNGENLRVSQTISGTTTYLAWDMSEELPLILSDGTNSYIYGPGGLPVEQISSGGTVTYLHRDQAGSTRLLTGSTGTVTGKCTYGAYGTPTCEGTSTTPLGYDAQYTSSDTGLIYLRGRTYDPATAQFLSVDPLVKNTRAPYTYAGDDPTTQADPTGLESSLCEIYNGIVSPEPGTHIESKAEKQEQERGEKAETRELEKDALEERALDAKLAKELEEIRARGRKALEADKYSEEPSIFEEVITKGVKAIGGCVAGTDVGTVTGGAAGAAVGGPVGAVAGATVGGPVGCVVGGTTAALSPVNPLQPSEGGP
jgi:RHS repeat-associated protein